jgi:hypothetical protein
MSDSDKCLYDTAFRRFQELNRTLHRLKYAQYILRIEDGRSTVSNLVQFTNGVIGGIEDGWQVDDVYTDFSKAFDRVLHGLLKFNLSI